jgi:hypothetical protein
MYDFFSLLEFVFNCQFKLFDNVFISLNFLFIVDLQLCDNKYK